MKKHYIICGKSLVSGIEGHDSGKMNQYFELGWETVGSRFDVIKMFNTGQLDPDKHVLVTTEDRMFFYTKFYPNVITWDEYQLKADAKFEGRFSDVAQRTTDWTEDHMALGFCQPGFSNNGRYHRFYEDADLIFNGWDLEGTIMPTEPFLVMNIRRRSWCDNRNSDMRLYQKLVREFRGIPIYVVGRGVESFCDLNRLNHVEKLKDYVSLIKNPRCISLISQATGTVAIAMTASMTDIHMIDPSGAGDIRGQNAVLGGTPIHFFTGDLYTYRMNDWKNKEDTEYPSLVGKIREKIEKMCKEPVDK